MDSGPRTEQAAVQLSSHHRMLSILLLQFYIVSAHWTLRGMITEILWCTNTVHTFLYRSHYTIPHGTCNIATCGVLWYDAICQMTSSQCWCWAEGLETHQYALMTGPGKKHKLDAKWTHYILVNYFLLRVAAKSGVVNEEVSCGCAAAHCNQLTVAELGEQFYCFSAFYFHSFHLFGRLKFYNRPPQGPSGWKLACI